MRRLLPRSLRSRLILSFGLLIFIAIFLAGLTTVYLVKTEQEKSAKERYELLALALEARSAVLEGAGLPPERIQEELERQFDVRILLVDQDDRMVVLRGADGHNQLLPRAELEEIQKIAQSVMPTGLLDGLDDQQVRDLFAYLRSTQPLND